eukprot:3814846-Alexandrium_andersonii.AAC.1
MSASLVGSEMCIRDRRACKQATAARGGRLPTSALRGTSASESSPSDSARHRPAWRCALGNRPSRTQRPGKAEQSQVKTTAAPNNSLAKAKKRPTIPCRCNCGPNIRTGRNALAESRGSTEA